MSFYSTIYGNPEPNQFQYTTTEVITDLTTTTDLNAQNANIVNLTTTTFSPVNIDGQNLTCDTATITDADITTAIINTSNTTTANTTTANITTANITSANIDDADIDTIILNESSSVLTDNSVIYRDANQMLFVGRQDVDTNTGNDYLFYTGLKAGTPKLKISRSNNIVEVIDLNVSNEIETSTIDSGLYLFSDSVINQDKSRIYREGNVLKIAQGAVAGDADASIHFFIGPPTGTPPLKIDKNNNKTTAIDIASDDLFSLRGTINTFNSTSISSPAISGDAIETKNILWNDKITSNDSYFDRENDVFRFNGSSGTTPVNWEFYKTSGVNPIVKIDASNDTMTIDGDIIGNISGNLSAGTGIGLSTASGITTISNIAPIPPTLNINTLNSTTINNSGTITTNILDSTTINNAGDINNTSGNINLDVNTGKVYANEFNGSIGRIRSIVSAQNGSYFLTNSTNTGSFAIFSSATGDFYLNTSPSNLNFGSTSASTGPVAMTINGSTKDIEIFTNLTAVDITSSGTITSNILNADISNNLTAGYGISLNTVSGNTTISSIQGIYFCATRTGNYAPGGGSTGYVLQYNNISATNGIAYSTSTGQATIPFTGLYSISASVNIDNVSVNARINIRCRIRINGSWFQGYPQAYGYIRNQNEVVYATATCSDWIVQLTQNDIIDVIAHVGVGTNNNFSSSFLGLQFFNGATFTIRRID